MDKSIKGQTICPTASEVYNIDLWVDPGGLSNPAQQYLLTAGLLQVCHHIFHHIFHLEEKKNFTKVPVP